MGKERNTSYEMIKGEDSLSERAVFSHEKSSLEGEKAAFFYTIYGYSIQGNYMDIKVGDRKTMVSIWPHYLDDVHLPELSAQDAHAIMTSPHRKADYDAICPPETPSVR